MSDNGNPYTVELGRLIKSGQNKGKHVCYVKRNNRYILSTKPLDDEQFQLLQEAVKDKERMDKRIVELIKEKRDGENNR